MMENQPIGYGKKKINSMNFLIMNHDETGGLTVNDRDCGQEWLIGPLPGGYQALTYGVLTASGSEMGLKGDVVHGYCPPCARTRTLSERSRDESKTYSEACMHTYTRGVRMGNGRRTLISCADNTYSIPAILISIMICAAAPTDGLECCAHITSAAYLERDS